MKRWMLLFAALAAACGDAGYGGITADLVFVDAPGAKRQELRSAAVPMIVDRLQIVALDADGSTLTDALGEVIETNLYATPAEGQLRLFYEGGEWSLSGVPAGPDRSIVAKAYLGSAVDPRVVGAVAYRGRMDGISVSPGETKNVGTLALVSTGIKIKEVDTEPPNPPNPVTVSAVPAGEALRVTFGQPPGAEGYVVAVTTSTLGQTPPEIEVGTVLQEGDEIAPGVRVDTIWPFAGPMIIDVDGLTDGRPYAVLVYAYDTDLDGRALNYSQPGSAFGIPQDTLPPDVVQGLSMVPSGNDAATISFAGPVEDRGVDGSGRVAGYEIRASTDRSQLTTLATFEALPMVTPPAPDAPGLPVNFTRTFAQLNVPGDTAFFIGVRALDDAANAGDIVVAELAANATLAPSLDRVFPEIGIAGREITFYGDNLGLTPGTVTLTTTGTSADVFTLPVSRWENGSVVATVPQNARSGTVELRRGSDGATVSTFLPVILRIDDAIQDYVAPLELVGATAADGARVISTLYREDGDFGTVEAALERFIGPVPESVPYVPFNQARSTVAAGTYSPVYDRFLFVASTDMTTMATLFVTSSTVAPDPRRFPGGVLAGNADGVGVVFLDGGTGGRYPALLAFTRDGTIRTATVTDALVEPFGPFFAETSTVAAYDRVKLTRNAAGDVLMAHRSVVGPNATLSVRLNQQGGAPDGFVEVAPGMGPEAGPNLEVVAAPVMAGGPESFVIAYESVEAGGQTEVRLSKLESFGAREGYAPFAATADDRRLEDVGLIIREGAVWLGVMASILDGNGSAQLHYTEVPLSALDGATPRGEYAGVNLDFAPDDTRGRAGCKPAPQLECPMVWSGDDANVFFLRR